MLPIRDLCDTPFCICPLFFTSKKHHKFRHIVRCLRCSFRVSSIDIGTAAYYKLRTTAHNCAQLRTTTHNYAQLRTMVDFIVSSIKLVFMILGISFSRVLYNNYSMIVYVKHIINIDDFPLNVHPPSVVNKQSPILFKAALRNIGFTRSVKFTSNV